jgi:parvulin-like peptidyl-prolyl isomerase
LPRIDVRAADVERLARMWERTWHRPPTETELQALVENHIRDEVYYREALAMGLERDDTVVRQRLRLKFEFITEDLLGRKEPSEESLARFYEENAERYREPDQVSFAQVYFSPSRRGASAEEDAKRALDSISSASEQAIEEIGDPISLDSEYGHLSAPELKKRFGEAFAVAIQEQPIDTWSGPVSSGYGLHLVRVSERLAGGQPGLAEVRERVLRDYKYRERQEASEGLYQKLKGRYQIHVEEYAPASGRREQSTAAVTR